MIRRPPRSTRTDTLFPYTTLFRSAEGLENYCNHMVGTYNGRTPDAPGWTLGGYSQQIVVHQRYVLRIRHPEEQLAAVAPLLCAGITTWSPLRHWQVGPGQKAGVAGLGGPGPLDNGRASARGTAGQPG